MKTILTYFALSIMLMFASSELKAQTKDPSGQNRYFKLGEKNTLSVFESPAYDFSDNFFDGYAEATIAELGLTGWKAWNEFGDHAELVAVTGTSKVLFKNGAQWLECYLVGCKKGGKLFYNRLRFIDKKIVEAGPEQELKAAPKAEAPKAEAPKTETPAATANGDQRLQDYKDGLATGLLAGKNNNSNNNCCCCGTQSQGFTQLGTPQMMTFSQPFQQGGFIQQSGGFYPIETPADKFLKVMTGFGQVIPKTLIIGVDNSTTLNGSGNQQVAYTMQQAATPIPQQQTQQQQPVAPVGCYYDQYGALRCPTTNGGGVFNPFPTATTTGTGGVPNPLNTGTTTTTTTTGQGTGTGGVFDPFKQQTQDVASFTTGTMPNLMMKQF